MTTQRVAYDEDFYRWAMHNAQLLRQQRLAEIDYEHIAEELEDRGKSERRELESHVKNGLLHWLKWRFQPALRSASWRQSIRNLRITIHKIFRDSPSLKSRLADIITQEYSHAREDAVDETGMDQRCFPNDCPFSIEQLVDKDFWPD